MCIKEALPDRKVKVIIYAPDNGKYVPIFRGMSTDDNKIFKSEFEHVAPAHDTYRFFLNE